MSYGNVTYQSYANIPFMNALPCITTNFGGDIQVATIPDYASAPIGVELNGLAQQALTPPLASLGPNIQVPSQDSINNYVNALYAPIANNIASGNINCNLQNINITRNKLNAMLLDEKYKDNKEEIEALLERLKKAEEELVELTTKTELSATEALKESNRIGDEIRNIINDANNIGKPKDDKKADKKDDKDKDKVDGKDNTDDTDKTDDEEKVDETENSQGKKEVKYSPQVKTAIETFYAATYCAGTDDPAMEEVVGSITSDNVMDYMTAWNKYHSGQKGESFMEAFMSDANEGFWGTVLGGFGINKLFGYGATSDQKVNGCRQVAYALREKAEELGIYDECKADFAKIDKELGSWLWIDDDIYKNFDNIIKKIANKMGPGYSKYGSPEKTGETKKD